MIVKTRIQNKNDIEAKMSFLLKIINKRVILL